MSETVNPLRTWREAQGISQDAAGALAGMAAGLWSRYERGLVMPGRAHMRRITEATGVTAAALAAAYYGEAHAALPVTRVWVVHTEWERSTDGSNSEVAGVYLSEQSAIAAQEAETREWMASPYDKVPYVDPDTGEDTSDWDFDVHVTACEVKS